MVTQVVVSRLGDLLPNLFLKRMKGDDWEFFYTLKAIENLSLVYFQLISDQMTPKEIKVNDAKKYDKVIIIVKTSVEQLPKFIKVHPQFDFWADEEGLLDQYLNSKNLEAKYGVITKQEFVYLNEQKRSVFAFL